MKQKTTSKNIISIDPGLSGTGWATWEGKTLTGHGVLFYTAAKDTWENRAQQYAQSIISISDDADCKTLYIEYPSFFDSVGGTMVAKTGDLLKLTFLVGIICGYASTNFVDYVLVPVNQWKGQLPKQIVTERIIRRLGEKQCLGIKTHAWDAVGIGLHALGISI